jgi:hypothetical protein
MSVVSISRPFLRIGASSRCVLCFDEVAMGTFGVAPAHRHNLPPISGGTAQTMRKQVHALLGQDAPQADAVVWPHLPLSISAGMPTADAAVRRDPPQKRAAATAESAAADDQPCPIVVTNYSQADQARSPTATR